MAQPKTEWAFSPAVVRPLRSAGLAIRTATSTDRVAMFDACRITMELIAPVDSFYVALVRTSSRHVLHPYTYDHGKSVQVSVEPYGERGLTAWMLASQRTYRYRSDSGRLVHAGSSFGDVDEISRDAIITPFHDPKATGERRVIGFMAVLANTPGVFTDEHVAAMEWLAGAVSERWERDAAHLDEAGAPFPELGQETPPDKWDVVNYAGVALRRVRDDLQNLATEYPEISQELLTIATRAEKYHDGLRRIVAAPESLADPFAVLTPRQREIAVFLVEHPGATNSEVAARLGITEATTKTHMSRLLAKLGLRQRSEIAWAVENKA